MPSGVVTRPGERLPAQHVNEWLRHLLHKAVCLQNKTNTLSFEFNLETTGAMVKEE